MENPIRAVLATLGMCLLVVLWCSYEIYAIVADGYQTNSTCEDGASNLVCIIDDEFMAVAFGSVITLDDIIARLPAVEDYEELDVETEEVTIESISMKVDTGRINTEPVMLEMAAIEEVNQTDYDIPEWDIHERINTINILWEFLVNQQELPETNASAIIGSICCEGDFGQKEGSKKQLQNIEEARRVLGNGNDGYGLVQWTYGSRQKTLLQYYELAYEQYPDDWEKTRIIAECCMLIEELKAYEVFEDIMQEIPIEEAVGRLSKNYFMYDGYWRDWSGYSLKSGKSNGRSRYNYAVSIHGYFTDVY